MNAITRIVAAAPDCAVDAATARLLADGFVVLRQAAAPELIRDIADTLNERFDNTPFSEGGFFGGSTKRFGRLLLRAPDTAALVQHEIVLGIARRILGEGMVQLNLTQAIAVHPGAHAQIPHRDQDMWAGPKGLFEYKLNVIWPMTDFTAENGATAVWRNSHRERTDTYIPDEGRFQPEMTPGDALIFLGSTLHGQGENRTDQVRSAIAIGYSLAWLKSYENQFLAYPPEVARNFAPDLAELVGYRQLSPNLNNYEGQSPAVLLRGDPAEHLGAVDCLGDAEEEAALFYAAEGHVRTR
ncbi:MAG: phytanoyl-CoA dioxygenase family protein [Sphingomonadales bacterium]|nr:MAG: phytanoyl-CoA dioxygenase family protein [Sphingomonadales bacterium]